MRTRSRRRAAALLVLLVLGALAVAGPHARALERPPALEQQAGCELWQGLGSGNDRSMIDEVRICPDDHGGFTGIIQHSSTTSGFGIRNIVGRIEHGTHYVWRDTAFVQNSPAPGWRFCLADEYRADKSSPTHMAGTYDSADCDDHGTITLDLVPEGDGRTGLEPAREGGGAGGGGTAQPPEPVVPVVPPLPPAPAPRRSMFGCD